MEVFNTTKDLGERGYSMRTPPLNLLCYDPAGDGKDNDAVVLVSREEWRRGELHDPDLAMEMIFRVLLAHRFPVGMEFPEKVASILNLNRYLLRMQRTGRQYAHVVLCEANGVGWAAASTLRQKISAPVMPYVTVGAAHEKPFINRQFSMPRLAALDNVRVLLETHHLKLAKDAHGAADLQQELGAFVWARPGRPEAIEGQRDDLVLALAGACWAGTKVIPPVTKQVRADPRSGIKTHLDRATTGNIRIH